jgi:hypothetical protein
MVGGDGRSVSPRLDAIVDEAQRIKVQPIGTCASSDVEFVLSAEFSVAFLSLTLPSPTRVEFFTEALNGST